MIYLGALKVLYRRKNMKKVVSIVLILVFLLSLTACATSTPTTSGSSPAASGSAPASSAASGSAAPISSGKPVEISVAFNSMPNGLDPVSEDVIPNLSISLDVYDRLFFRDTSNTNVPAVAKSVKQIDDVTWQFEINLDYVFQNGDKLTMDDVVFSITRLKDIPKSADIGKLIDTVTYEGTSLTVKVLKANNTIVPRIINTAIIVNKAYITANGDDAIYMNPIGTGPYKVTKFVPGTTAVLETWSGYPFAQPQITKITYTAIPENANRYIAVETGKVQYAALVSSLEMNLAEKNDKLSTMRGDSLKVTCFVFNTEKTPFNNVDVRRALAYAFDRASFCALQGGRPEAASMIFAGYKDLYTVPDTMPTFDLEKAKQLLESAGYNASNPLQFELVYWTADPGLELYQSTLKTIGVEMSLKQVEFSTYLSLEGPGDFTMMYTAQTNRGGLSLTDLDRFDSTLIGTRDISRYSNDQVQSLIELMRVTNDQEELKNSAIEMSKILGQDVPMFAAFQQPLFSVTDKNLSGVVLRGDMWQCFRFATYKA
jgi:peptide/nickel transport system substrate-binding protein